MIKLIQIELRFSTHHTSLLLCFIAVIFIAALTGKSYALNNESGSGVLLAKDTSALLDMDIKNLMDIEVISATRSAIPISKTAANMTVITAEDIELMNAHTLKDILSHVTGIFVDGRGGPGTIGSTITSQGISEERIAFYIDGIPMNNLSTNNFEFGSVPVQNIERVEVIRGPVSSAWGSSLGGLINVITKSPAESGSLRGTVSADYGERNTQDFRADAAGKYGKFGYYAYAGRLATDGMIPATDVESTYLQGKLSYDINADNKILLNIYSDMTSRGEGATSDPHLNFTENRRIDQLLSSLTWNSTLSSEVSLDLMLWDGRDIEHFRKDKFTTGALTSASDIDDKKEGVNAKLNWEHGMHNVLFGADYYHYREDANTILNGNASSTRYAAYINDTITLGKLSLTPGVRYDDTRQNGNFISPSAGATYRLTSELLFRASVERGFYTPSFANTFGSSPRSLGNPNLKVENVMSYQAGVEAALLSAVWLKATLFRHDIRDAIVSVENLQTLTFMNINGGRQISEGIDAEFRTQPVYNTSLLGGVEYVHTKDFNTGQFFLDTPGYIYDVGLKYDDRKSLRALLQGRYWWIANRSQYPYAIEQGRYSSMIFDFNLIKSLYSNEKNRAEVFFTAHNLFNGSQYLFEIWRNPRRWVEAGIRYKF